MNWMVRGYFHRDGFSQVGVDMSPIHSAHTDTFIAQ